MLSVYLIDVVTLRDTQTKVFLLHARIFGRQFSLLFSPPLKVETTQTASIMKGSKAQKVRAVSCSGIRGLVKKGAEKSREEIASFLLLLLLLSTALAVACRARGGG